MIRTSTAKVSRPNTTTESVFEKTEKKDPARPKSDARDLLQEFARDGFDRGATFLPPGTGKCDDRVVHKVGTQGQRQSGGVDPTQDAQSPAVPFGGSFLGCPDPEKGSLGRVIRKTRGFRFRKPPFGNPRHFRDCPSPHALNVDPYAWVFARFQRANDHSVCVGKIEIHVRTAAQKRSARFGAFQAGKICLGKHGGKQTAAEKRFDPRFSPSAFGKAGNGGLPQSCNQLLFIRQFRIRNKTNADQFRFLPFPFG